ncbi:MAG: non-heme iron oxygenase ferredoxin subunit [Calditrichaeota bacterium]|nr:non-heme iron oxygenase ferredoxin subunit [Calditrichota bacterium]
MSRTEAVLAFDRLEEGKPRRVKVESEEIVLVRLKDKVYALEDRCSHEDYPLSEGWVDDGKLCCSLHGAQFDPATGEALTLPAYEDVRTYPTRVIDGTVEIDLEREE